MTTLTKEMIAGAVGEVFRESERHRLLRAEQNIRVRLGGSTSLAEPFPPKPKGMHWNTYFRLRHKALRNELWWLKTSKFSH